MSPVVYGRMSRLTYNPNPRVYEPVVAPGFKGIERDPELDKRYCWTGRHFTTDPERWANDKGCSKHPTVTGRATTRKGRAAKSHFCSYCKQLKPHTSFLRAVFSLAERVCDACAERMAA